MRQIALAGLAALALIACGKKEEAVAVSRAAAGAASPIDAPFRLEGAKPVEADAVFALLPEAARPSYDRASFDARLGALVTEGLVFTNPATGETIRAARAEFYGVDAAAAERAKTGPADADAPFEKLFEKVRLFDVVAAPGPTGEDGQRMGGNGRAAGIEIDRLSVRRGALAPETQSFDDPDAEERPGGLARFFNAFELGGFYVKDLAVDGEEDPTGGKLNFRAPDVRIAAVGGGRIGAVLANRFEYDMTQTPYGRMAMAQSFGAPGMFLLNGPLGAFVAPAEQTVRVAAFEWRDIDFSAWMGPAARGATGRGPAETPVDLGRIVVRDAETLVGGKRAAKVAETTVSSLKFAGAIPSMIRSETKGGEYDFSAYLPPEEAEAAVVLKKHGLDKVKGSGGLTWDWAPKGGDAALKGGFKTDRVADLDLSFELVGDASASAPGEDMAERLRFKGFSLSLADKKLLDAVFDLSALQTGQPAADLRAAAPAMIRLSGMQAAQASPRLGAVVDAVAKFVGEGGTLTISAKPAAPVALSALAAAGPDGAAEQLAIEATHKKK